MQADIALKSSRSRVIVNDTSLGLVIIQQRLPPEAPAPTSFKLFFISHDMEGWHDGSGIMTVGSYDELEVAVMTAAVKYGVADEAWLPANRYSIAILGEMLLQNSPIDASSLAEKSPEPG